MSQAKKKSWTWVLATAVLVLAGCSREQVPAPQPKPEPPKPGPVAQVPVLPEKPVVQGPPKLPALFRDIERRTFQFFWDTTNDLNGLTPDRYPSRPFASIASVGFALTAYPIGVENGWVSRTQAVDRTLVTLKFFDEAKQGRAATGTAGNHGFFYHFLDMQTGHRYAPWVELSTVDTALLLGGVLFAQSYFTGDDPREKEIRERADRIYKRVDWPKMQERKPLLSMGWTPEGGMINHDWRGYNEAMLLYILALGSPTHPLKPDAWHAWTATYDEGWGVFMGQEYLSFGPQFGHQYSHVWVDFRGIRDEYMKNRGIDYFENSRRATYAQREYAIKNPMKWKDYGEDVWGLTASDGPQFTTQEYMGEQRQFRHYSARGAGLRDAFDDGTIAPTAALGSLPFAPEIVIPAAEAMFERYGEYIFSSYGFLDAFNPSFTYDVPMKTGRLVPGGGWVASDYIGIDQGPILAMIANYRDDFVWKTMRENKYIRKGLEQAGFTGGWLAKEGEVKWSGPPDPKAAEERATGAAESRSSREEEAPPAQPHASDPPM